MEKARAIDHACRAPCVQRRLEQRESAEHVGLQKRLGIDDRSIDMGFGGQMDDTHEFMLVEQPPHQRRIPDIALDEQDAVIRDQRFKTSQVCRVGHGIDDDQPVVGTRRAPRMHKVLADETGASGDQNAMHGNPWLLDVRSWYHVPLGGKSSLPGQFLLEYRPGHYVPEQKQDR